LITPLPSLLYIHTLWNENKLCHSLLCKLQQEDLIRAKVDSASDGQTSAAVMSPAEARAMKIKELREQAKAKAKAREMLKGLEKDTPTNEALE
jgi:hypothetical protein